MFVFSHTINLVGVFMKRVIFSLLVALVCLCLPGLSHAEEEELAPGFNACMDKAVSTADMVGCMNAGIEHWDKVLAKNYAEAEKGCLDPDKARCDEYRSLLRASMKSWKAYRSDTASYLGQVSGGSMDRLSAAMFYLQVTKQYAEAIAVDAEE